MWLFQISSAADNYLGKMQIAERMLVLLVGLVGWSCWLVLLVACLYCTRIVANILTASVLWIVMLRDTISESNPGTQQAQLLLAYSEAVAELDESSLLVTAFKQASVFVNILAELTSSLVCATEPWCLARARAHD
jgi:hypothetical protein